MRGAERRAWMVEEGRRGVVAHGFSAGTEGMAGL